MFVKRKGKGKGKNDFCGISKPLNTLSFKKSKNIT